jgi:Tat protein secretion system quality control protein TatD with DNase activity
MWSNIDNELDDFWKTCQKTHQFSVFKTQVTLSVRSNMLQFAVLTDRNSYKTMFTFLGRIMFQSQ